MKEDHELYQEYNAAAKAGKDKEWWDNAMPEERDRVYNYMTLGTIQGMLDILRLMGIAIDLDSYKSGDQSVSLPVLEEKLDAIKERWPD